MAQVACSSSVRHKRTKRNMTQLWLRQTDLLKKCSAPAMPWTRGLLGPSSVLRLCFHVVMIGVLASA